jgi:NAD-dependent deacetylase
VQREDAATGCVLRIEAGEPDPPCRDCGGILKTATVMFGDEVIREPIGTSLPLLLARL